MFANVLLYSMDVLTYYLQTELESKLLEAKSVLEEITISTEKKYNELNEQVVLVYCVYLILVQNTWLLFALFLYGIILSVRLFDLNDTLINMFLKVTVCIFFLLYYYFINCYSVVRWARSVTGVSLLLPESAPI